MDGWLDGAWDLHVHVAPSFFARWGDGVDLAGASQAAGMAGVLLKAHEGSTTEMAAVLSRTHAPLRVAGGVVLNRFVGGINPEAVEAALRLGARCVWLPTIHAPDHARAFGALGGYPQQGGGPAGGEPVPVTEAGGALRPQAREVVALVRDHGALLATGHAGWDEVEAVLAAATDLGLERVLVQHVCFATPGPDLDAIVRAVGRGACVELTALAVSPRWGHATVAACAEAFRRAGDGAVVVSSDAGQAQEPAPPDALAAFAAALHEHGVPAAHVRRALRETPARLLGMA
jgi:hypothetical protein